VSEDFAELRTRLAEVVDVDRAAEILRWDQQTMMPPRGASVRAEQLATLGRIAHERLTDPGIGRLLERLEPFEAEHEYDSVEASLIRVTRRDWEKERKVPGELRAELSRAAALGYPVWVDARARNDFASFLPVLRQHLELKRRYVECLADEVELGWYRGSEIQLDSVCLELISLALPVSACVPAPGQGIVAIEIRADDDEVRRVVAGIEDPAAADALDAERALVAALGGGCQTPIGALASPVEGDELELLAAVVSLDGSRAVRGQARGPRRDAAALGARVGAQLLADGADQILLDARTQTVDSRQLNVDP